MLKNYFKIALRNLKKYTFISFINIFGLTIGLTCCLLILAYILNELSFDRYNDKADRIYRVTRSFNNKEGVVSLHLGTVAPPFGPLLQHYFPDIQKMTRLLPNGTTSVRFGDKLFNEKNTYFADENLVNVFNVTVTKGNPQKALLDPFSVMLTEDVAKKYFGNEDPMNKVIRIGNQYDLKVTGIFKDFPANAHIHPSILFSFNTLKDTTVYGEKNLETNYGNNSFFTYILLPAGYPINSIEKQLDAFLDREVHFQGAPAGYKVSTGTHLYLQKLTDIHLRSHLDYEAEENGDIKRVYIFSAIALFILLIACINYMNLSTARSALRAREIGIRKVAGAERNEIIAQFLSESIFISVIAIILAFVFTALTLPWLNKLSGQELTMAIFGKWQVILPLITVPFVVGILSGLYPALFMSSFKPVAVLKGLFKATGSSISFRKVLVVSQFAISIILIISTGVVFRQLRYMQMKSLGFDKEHIITMDYSNDADKQYDNFRNTLLRDTRVKNLTRSSRIPSGRLLDEQNAAAESGDSLAPVTADIKYLAADYDFIPTFGIQMAAGRNFSRDFALDSASFILNEAAVQALGWKTPEKSIGKNFSYANTKGKIVGIMKDFHFESLHQKIVPMILVWPGASQTSGSFGHISVKVSGNDIPATLGLIESTWKKMVPEQPFQYNFMDDNFDKLYDSEHRQGGLFTIFACIAIFIACLGLFGLSAFAITQRIKEIGIRKVLGASVGNIVGLLSRDFLRLIVIAAVIAFPVAWYAMHNWLDDFAYRSNMPWWIFIVAGIMAGVVALATVSFQAIRAALSNPVKNLRTE